MVPGDAIVFDTYDAICKTMDHMPDADLLYPPEFSVRDTPNFPRHSISVKGGVPVMVLQSINQSIGPCNVSRLMVTRLG